MRQWLVFGFVALVAASAVVVMALFGTLSLVDPAGRFPHHDALGVAGQLEASRNISIALLVVGVSVARYWRGLGLALLLCGSVELGDTIVGIGQGQLGQTLPPFLSGLLYIAVGSYLLARRSPRSQTSSSEGRDGGTRRGDRERRAGKNESGAGR